MPQSATRSIQTRALAEELYRAEYPHLLAIAQKNGARSEAADAVSRALAIFIAKFDPNGPAPALPWLITTVKREAWQLQRSRMRREAEQRQMTPINTDDELNPQLDVLDVDAPDPEERALAAERVCEAREALAQLKPNERRCLGLKAGGYSYKEIGELTGWSHTKINRLMVEGRERLRRLAR